MNTEGSPASKVLIVEDNKVNQLVARRMVERLGYQTDVVENGKLALEALSGNAYALVLMDCQMPVMDGYEATMEIRRREPPNQHLPIVALTAHVLDNNREQCLGVGMDDFVAKPVTNTQLKDVLDRWMQPPANVS